MNKIVNILTVMLVAVACKPTKVLTLQTTTQTTDSIAVKVTTKDSAFSIPGDSVFVPIQLLQNPARAKQFGYALTNPWSWKNGQPNPAGITEAVLASSASGRLTAKLVERNGSVGVLCVADSLQKRIIWLETQLERYRNTYQRTEVPVPVIKKEPYIPTWVKVVLLVSILGNAWSFRRQIRGLFFNAITRL